MDKSDEDKTPAEVPTPDDFDEYLPWACAELRMDVTLAIVKVQSQDKSNLANAKFKKDRSRHDVKSKHETDDSDSTKSLDGLKFFAHPENTVTISTVYDIMGNLIQLKFEKNKKIPMQLLKLIGLFIHYHKFMTNIVINSGIDNGCLYELKNLLVLANITDVCLDNTSLLSYDLILEEGNTLKHLSMARCKIDDSIVKNMAIHLRHPQPASKTLLALNLTSNLISDTGAQHLANALRTNRKLVYLNLADNKITDQGAGKIFDALTVFLVTNEEIMSFRQRKVEYIRDRNCLINYIAQELKCIDFEKKNSKKKLVKQTNVLSSVPTKKSNEKDHLKTAGDRSITDLEAIDPVWFEKAKLVASERMGQFSEPFSAEHVYENDGLTYCYGNNRMAYINISYNNVGYLTVKKILSILLKQKDLNRRPNGLINVSLEGNYIPSRCRELKQIDSILLSGGSAARRTHNNKQTTKQQTN